MNDLASNFLCTTTLIIGLAASGIAPASTHYTFTAISGTATGTIEFSSPPATNAAPWRTSDTADIILVDVVLSGEDLLGNPITVSSSNLTPPFVLIAGSDIVSDSGSELDAGQLFYDIPMVVDEPYLSMTFSSAPGGDRIVYFAALAAVEVLGDWTITTVSDADGDGIDDSLDNCTNDVNPDQQDTDTDGLGNICDADFDNNCITTFPDLSIMKAGFFTVDPLLDLDSSGGPVNFADLAIMQNLFFLPPGPSGLPNACTPLGQGDVCDVGASLCGAGLTCCYPCGVPGCEFMCAVTCDPSTLGCFDGCFIFP